MKCQVDWWFLLCEKARFALGRVYWKLKNSQHAIQNYEDFINVAKVAKNISGTVEAAANLLEVYIFQCFLNKIKNTNEDVDKFH